MEQHLIHIKVLDTATSQGRKSKINETQTEKDGELEKEERNNGKQNNRIMERKNRNLMLIDFLE